MSKDTREQLEAKIEGEILKRQRILINVPVGDKEAWDSILEEIKGLESDLVTVRGTKIEKKSNGLDMNTIVQAGVGLASILLILNYEKTDILTSKAVPVAMKWIGR